MKKIFFTPGPSQLFPTVKKHIQEAIEENIPSISHRGEKFHGIFQNTQNLLRKLLKIPNSHKIFFLSSGTEAMERIIENTVEKYSLHFVNGAFSERFYQTAVELGKKAEKIEVNDGEGFYMDRQSLRHLKGGQKKRGQASSFQVEELEKAELICFTHNETSTGVALPLEDIYKLKIKNPKKLVALDTVSSAPYANVNYRYIDLCFFSVQKGFGLPAGLGVIIVSPQALEKSSVGSYHSFDNLLKYEQKSETPETPNVLAIYLLGKVVSDMLKAGIKRIRAQTEKKAKLLYDFFDKSKIFKPFVRDSRFRSQTVVAVKTQKDSAYFIKDLKQKGLIVGSGYGEFKARQLRIANFPAHSIYDIERLIREF